MLVALLPAFALDSFLPCHTYNSCNLQHACYNPCDERFFLLEQDLTSPPPYFACRFVRTQKTATRKIPSSPSFGKLSCLAQWGSTLRRATWLDACSPSAPKKTFYPSGTKIMTQILMSGSKSAKGMNCMCDRAKMNQVQMLATVPQARVDTSNSS